MPEYFGISFLCFYLPRDIWKIFIILNTAEKWSLQGEAIFYIRSTYYFTLDQTEKDYPLGSESFLQVTTSIVLSPTLCFPWHYKSFTEAEVLQILWVKLLVMGT